jgi:hypothetical protein
MSEPRRYECRLIQAVNSSGNSPNTANSRKNGVT